MPTWVREMKYVYFERSNLTENNTITSVKDKKAIKIQYKSKYMSQKYQHKSLRNRKPKYLLTYNL